MRQILATYERVEDLIQAGAYEPGASADTDRAIALLPRVNRFLQQSVEQTVSFENTQQELQVLAAAWANQGHRQQDQTA